MYTFPKSLANFLPTNFSMMTAIFFNIWFQLRFVSVKDYGKMYISSSFLLQWVDCIFNSPINNLWKLLCLDNRHLSWVDVQDKSTSNPLNIDIFYWKSCNCGPQKRPQSYSITFFILCHKSIINLIWPWYKSFFNKFYYTSKITKINFEFNWCKTASQDMDMKLLCFAFINFAAD